MREYSAPETYRVPATGSLTDDVLANARDYGEQVGFCRRAGNEWIDVTWAEFLSDVRAAAKGLIAAGVCPGERVALLSKTRYEWTVLDYAIWFAGAVTVPIYETSSTEQVGWILADSGAVLALAETSAHVERIAKLGNGVPELREVVCIEEGQLAALVHSGAAISDERLEERRSALRPNSLATLIYTSGTTGQPKGCRLTHANFMFELSVATSELRELYQVEGASTLLFLPLAHVFARIVSIGCVKARVRLGHTADVRNLIDDLRTFRPLFILAVPRVFEKVFNTASHQATSNGKAAVFKLAVNTAIAYSRAVDRSGPGLLLRVRHTLLDRLVYGQLRDALGGNTRYAVSGGAPLGERLAHFFRGIGIPVLEGYGLTETTAALTINLPTAFGVGTVGKPLPGTTIAVAADGELLCKGPQVFDGYWADDQATSEVLRDGWFHTGDVGEIDDQGYVRVTGRKKEILVTAGGKNVAPAVLEDQVRAHPLVSQCLVVGDRKPYIAALITLDEEAMATWLESRGKSAIAATALEDSDLLAEVQSAVDEANGAVSQAEQIRRFTILHPDWTEEGGELTPTLKLKRTLLMNRYQEDIEALYD